jgi:hypothetical protein
MTTPPSPSRERVSSTGLAIIAIVLLAFALLAVYANLQKFRRAKIETVTITVAATPSPSPSP